MSLFLWLNTGYFLIVAIISEIPAMIHIMEAIDGGISSPTLYNSSLYRMFGDNICNKHSIQVILINTNKNIFKLLKLITISLNRKFIYIGIIASSNWFYLRHFPRHWICITINECNATKNCPYFWLVIKRTGLLSSSCQRDYDLKEIKGHAHRLRPLWLMAGCGIIDHR